MRIGCPKESKNREYRVGLNVESAQILINDGHEVWVESGVADGIGQSDADYRNVGARIAANTAELLDAADLLVKVKQFNSDERRLLQPRHTLFGFLALASDPAQTSDLLASGAVCLAYETVTSDAGTLPLLVPMSEISGRMAVLAASVFLQKRQGGMGVLLSGATGVDPGKVVVIGGGTVGSNAARIALGLGARVSIVTRTPARRKQLRESLGPELECVESTPGNIERLVLDADMVVGALLVPGGRVPKLVPESLVKRMKKGAVIADVCIDQGGCVETSRPTTHDEPTFIKHGVVHYCIANIPGTVPVTATRALNRATLPFVRQLANQDIRQALEQNEHLRRGMNICRGHITFEAVAQALGQECMTPERALEML